MGKSCLIAFTEDGSSGVVRLSGPGGTDKNVGRGDGGGGGGAVVTTAGDVANLRGSGGSGGGGGGGGRVCLGCSGGSIWGESCFSTSRGEGGGSTRETCVWLG